MQINTTESHAFTDMVAQSTNDGLGDYATHLSDVVERETWQSPESSICLPNAKSLYQESIDLIDSMVSDSLQYVFLVGIGGSNLGTVAVHTALRNRFAHTNSPELINLDTVSAADIRTLSERFGAGLEPETYLVFVISKSGQTTETIANAELLYQSVLVHDAARLERTIVITDEGSALDQYAVEQEISRLHIPAVVGGRYSVLSPVGIAPLYALGHPVHELVQGARDSIAQYVNLDQTYNPAAQVASGIVAAIARGYTVYDLFVFDPALESLGAWNRQLVGESIGKRENVHGAVVATGIVPTVSVGSTDLHSVGQLYLGGTPTILTMFVSVANPGTTYSIPEAGERRRLPSLVPDINGRSTADIQQAILAGTKDAYNEADRPFCAAALASSSAYEIGAFMQYKMIETMYVAHLLEVNAFDQPNVELYKTFTKEYLQQTT